MEKGLEKFSDICYELLQNPNESSVRNFSDYMTEELKSGHINQLSQSFKNITDAVEDLSETGNSTLEQLFSLDFHLIIQFIFDTLVDHDVVYTTDAVESLLSLFVFLSTICEKSWSGKVKLVSIVPVLLRDIIVNVERGIPLRIEAVKLTNMILGDVVNDEVDSTDAVSLAFKELEDKMEHLLVTAGDFELQAGMVELIFRLIPCDTRHKRAREYFSTDLVSSAFCDITSPEFEAGCRNFLNTLNQSQKENQSVASIPCYSASFGKTEVHQPRDEKIQDFWVDFNLGSKSISLFVEENDQEVGDYKEGGSWETVLVKAENVEDYRLKGTSNDDLALLLKLKHAASDLVSFGPDDTSQYIKFTFNASYTSVLTPLSGKIFGDPNIQNTGGDSDVSLTPSTKASVTITPVHIKSNNTEMAYVMPTPSVMSQVTEEVNGDSTTKGEDTGGKEHSTEVETKKIPVKRVSKRLQTTCKVQSKKDQRKSADQFDHDMSKSDSSEKSLPSAFNVSSRLAASKGKSLPKSLSSAAKSRKAIREKVFSKGHFHSLVESKQKPKENVTEFHMVTPARRLEPRSGGAQRNKTKEDNDEIKDESVDIVQDSLPLAEGMEDERGQNQQDQINSNQGFGLKKKRVAKKESEQDTGSILISAANDKWRTQKSKPQQMTKVKVTESGEFKEGTANRRASQSAKAKQQLRSPHCDQNDVDISSYDYDTRQDESVLEGNKSKANRKTSQMKKAKQQQQIRSPVHNENEPDISNEENESYLEVYGGSGYITECYVEEASTVLESSTTVTKSLQTPKSSVESGENSEEEETQASHFKLQLFESTSTGEASRNDFQLSDASDATEHNEEKEGSEDKFDFVHRHFEMPYDFGINRTPGYRKHNQKRQDRRLHRPNTGEGESHLKHSALRNDSGIGETPFVEQLKKQTKLSKKRSRKQLPLQIFSSPITPRSERSEPMEQDEGNSVDMESDEESLLSHGSQKQAVDRGQRRKRTFVEWSRSGPSNLSGLPVSGTFRSEHSEGCYKEPLHVSEAHLQSYRSQHIGKPRKLSYEDTPYNQQEPEQGISDEEVIRREVQGLINLAGSETVQAVRRKRRMVRSFFQRTNDMMLSSIDSFRDETQTTSYGALEKYKNQFSEQVQGLRKQMEKTTLILGGMEETFNTVAKQFKILKSQRQVEEKRFKGLQHLQGLMETEVTKLERKRNEQEATLRTEMEKEMLKLQNRFLQEIRKQTEDHFKMALNTLLFP